LTTLKLIAIKSDKKFELTTHQMVASSKQHFRWHLWALYRSKLSFNDKVDILLTYYRASYICKRYNSFEKEYCRYFSIIC